MPARIVRPGCPSGQHHGCDCKGSSSQGVLARLMLNEVPPVWNMYVDSVAFLTCPAQSLAVRSTGMGCFFFWKNFLPATNTVER